MFAAVDKAKSSADIIRISSDLNLEDEIKINMPIDEKYPRLSFRFEDADFNVLQHYLNDDLMLKSDLSTGKVDGKILTPLEKLLYAILWKNGDLGKERLLLRGIQSGSTQDNRNDDAAVVFFEFGRFLANNNVFILDQHTLRCHSAYNACVENSDDKFEYARKLNSINKYSIHAGLIENYKKYYSGLKNKIDYKNTEFYYHLDRLLFGVGKMIKCK
jgi:hypothetical protein